MTPQPPSTLFRFALLRLLPGALFINFAINYLIGWLIYGSYKQIPLWGGASILVDTAVGTLLIAFFSYLSVETVSRREANAGRIAGGGHKGVFLWLENNAALGGLLFGLVLAVACTLGIWAFFHQRGSSSLSTSHFLWFKALFSATIGAIASYGAAVLAVQSAAAPYDDPRWCKEPEAPVNGVTYPCDYIDKGAIAVTNERNGCSGTPTWQLVVKGNLDAEHVRTALEDTITRYPSLATLIQSLDGHPEYATHFRYATNPNFSLDDIYDVVDLRGKPEDKFAGLLQERLNRHTDQFRDPPMTLSLVYTKDEECRLLFRQHHGIADGRAFIELLVDFANYLNAAQEGRRPSEEDLAPIHRRPELEALGLEEKEQAKLTSAGFNWFVGSFLGRYLKPTTHLLQNESNDYTGGNGTIHWVFSDEVLSEWKPKSREHGVNLNSLLKAAIFDANRSWHKEMSRPLGKTVGTMVMETRPRDGSFRSFANHLATLEVEIDLDSDDSTLDIARSVHAQVKEQRDSQLPTKRLLIEQKLVASLPMDQVTSHVFDKRNASDNVNFSNLIPLKIPNLEGDGWLVDEILITTPITPRHGIIVTVIRYNGKIIFNINYKESAVTREEAETFFRHFRTSVVNALGVAPEEVPSGAVAPPPLPVKEAPPSPLERKPWFAKPSGISFLTKPTIGWMWSLAAVLLTLSTLFIGIVLDDQLQHLQVSDKKSPHNSDARPLDLFHFISDSNRKALMESGAYPWWTAPKLQLAFFRPISSATHWLDYKLWPSMPVLMHIHSLLWLIILVLLTTALYRRMIPVLWVAGLAGLLYAIDEAHGLGVGFLANRNALISTSFAVLTLILHDRWRRHGWTLGALLGPLALALGLLSAEFALFATAYLFAYSVFLEKKGLVQRFLPLIPYGVVVVGWRVIYKMLGYGAFHSGAYIDPLGEPVRFLTAVLERLPTLLLAQWTFVSADFWMVNTHTYNITQAALGAAFLGLIAWTLRPLFRESATARFWGLGMLLAGLPICATFPHDRILFGVGIGAMGLIAQFIGFRFHATQRQEREQQENDPNSPDPFPKARFTPRSWGVRTLAAFLVLCHVYLAAIFLPMKALAPMFLRRLEARAYQTAPKDPSVTKKSVILLQTPGFLAHTLFAMYALRDQPQPKLMRQLSITLKPLKVRRDDAHTLTLTATDFLVDRSTRYLVRSTALKFRQGEVFRRKGVTVTVTKLGPSGRPQEAAFRFDKPLRDPSYLWMVWKDKGFVPYKPPAVGKTEILPAIDPVGIFF